MWTFRISKYIYSWFCITKEDKLRLPLQAKYNSRVPVQGGRHIELQKFSLCAWTRVVQKLSLSKASLALQNQEKMILHKSVLMLYIDHFWTFKWKLDACETDFACQRNLKSGIWQFSKLMWQLYMKLIWHKIYIMHIIIHPSLTQSFFFIIMCIWFYLKELKIEPKLWYQNRQIRKYFRCCNGNLFLIGNNSIWNNYICLYIIGKTKK